MRLESAQLAAGTTVEGVCAQLRRLLVEQAADSLSGEALVVMCDLAQGDRGAIEVTLVSGVAPGLTDDRCGSFGS